MRWTAVALAALAGLAAGCSADPSESTAGSGPAADRIYLLGSAAELRQLPTSGRAWEAVVAASEADLDADLADQELRSSGALAAGLVYARTGDERARDRVVDALRRLPGTERGGRTLALGRQLAGWVLAADLVDFRDPAFLAWLDDVRTAELGGHGRWASLVETHEETASNWGTLAGASRLAASLYLDDGADVEQSVLVFRGWLGEPEHWPALPIDGPRDESGFLPSQDFDPTWACSYPAWTPVNGPCGDRDGALVEDISRGDPYPLATEAGIRYSWEALQGAVLQAVLLAANGHPDVWNWGDQALRRAGDFLERVGSGAPEAFAPINHWVATALDAVYGGAAADPATAGAGRSFGFTDWLAPLLTR